MLAVSFTEGWFFFSGTGTDEGQSTATLPSAVVKWKCSWEDRFLGDGPFRSKSLVSVAKKASMQQYEVLCVSLFYNNSVLGVISVTAEVEAYATKVWFLVTNGLV